MRACVHEHTNTNNTFFFKSEAHPSDEKIQPKEEKIETNVLYWFLKYASAGNNVSILRQWASDALLPSAALIHALLTLWGAAPMRVQVWEIA